MPEPTLTDRLLLTPIDPADEVVLGRLFAIQADPATWTHLPEGVETDLSQTRSLAEDHARSWREQGLGWWAVGLREATAGFPEGAIVGLGGAGVAIAQMHQRRDGVGFRPLGRSRHGGGGMGVATRQHHGRSPPGRSRATRRPGTCSSGSACRSRGRVRRPPPRR